MDGRVGSIPIVYHPSYNMKLCGADRLVHSLETKLYGQVFETLCTFYGIDLTHILVPSALSPEDLQQVHSKAYLASLRRSPVVAKIAGIPLLSLVPNAMLQRRLLSPMSLAAAGTLLAAEAALQHGWAINLGGGYHRAATNGGEQGCFFADIPLAVHKLLTSRVVSKILIVDLNAHAGDYSAVFAYKDFNDDASTSNLARHPNDHGELVFVDDDRVHVFDAHIARSVLPHKSARFITYPVVVPEHCSDTTYIQLLQSHLLQALATSAPNLVIYCAGTDTLVENARSGLALSAQGILHRDELVFKACRRFHVPVAMLLSKGCAGSASAVCRSIRNLSSLRLIALPEPVSLATSSSEGFEESAHRSVPASSAEHGIGACMTGASCVEAT